MSYRLAADGSLAFPSGIKQYFDSLGEDGAEQYAKFVATYGDLEGTPNGRFFAGRMTLLNQLSQHKSGPLVYLSADGANLKSLVGKPIHFTPEFSQHREAAAGGKRTIRTFGVTLGGTVHPTDEKGAVPIDVFGLMYDDDYPEEVEFVQANADQMGMSWEVKVPPSALRRHKIEGRDVVYAKECNFGGTAILKREHAAYPDSYMIVADASGKETTIDLDALPPLEAVKQTASSRIPEGISNNHPPGPVSPGPKEPFMSGDHTFCASCQPHFTEALRKGEIVLQEELESQKEWRDLEAARDTAIRERDEMAEKYKAEKERADNLQAEKENDIRTAKAQNLALEDWDREKDEFSGEEDVRKEFLAAREKIHLQESAESVKEGFEAYMTLKAEKGGKPKGNDRRPLPFDANAGVGPQRHTTDMPDDERRARSRAFLEKQYSPERMRLMVHGEGVQIGSKSGYQQGG